MAVTRLSHEQITCRAETCFQVSAFTPHFIQEIFCLRNKCIKRCLQKWSHKELLILLLRGRSCLHSLVKESQLVLAYKRPLQQSCFSSAILLCQQLGINGCRTPAGTWPGPHPLSRRVQVTAGSQQVKHNIEVPQDPRKHHPPW